MYVACIRHYITCSCTCQGNPSHFRDFLLSNIALRPFIAYIQQRKVGANMRIIVDQYATSPFLFQSTAKTLPDISSYLDTSERLTVFMWSVREKPSSTEKRDTNGSWAFQDLYKVLYFTTEQDLKAKWPKSVHDKEIPTFPLTQCESRPTVWNFEQTQFERL